MNRRVCACVGFACIGSIVWSGIALAQTPFSPREGGLSIPSSGGSSGTAISASVKNAPDARSFRPQIQQFVQSQLPALTGDDAAAQKTAREKLAAECSVGSTSSFFDVYSQELAAAVTPVLVKGPSLRVRLSAAVLIETVARVGQSPSIEPAILALLKDPLEPVAYWGVKAAKPVIGAVAQNAAIANTDPLIPAILPAVKLHPKSGYLAAEAYNALIPQIVGLNPAQVEALAPLVLSHVLDILEFRISLYNSGIPENPQAENPVGNFLAKSYAGAPVAQQHRIVQNLINLIALAGQQAQTAAKADIEQIIPMLKYASGALEVIAGSNAASILDPVVHLSPGSNGATVAKNTKPVFGAVQQLFPWLLPPPTITPAPASTTTAGSPGASPTAAH